MKYNRSSPNKCRPLGDAKEAWFYVNEGSIVVLTNLGGQAVITRAQLQAALAAMRPLRRR